MNLLRRLLPAVQVADCKGCGRPLFERRRRPCPTCGSTARIVRVGFEAGSLIAQDKLG